MLIAILTGEAGSCGRGVLPLPRQEPGVPGRGSQVTGRFEAENREPRYLDHFENFATFSQFTCPLGKASTVSMSSVKMARPSSGL